MRRRVVGAAATASGGDGSPAAVGSSGLEEREGLKERKPYAGKCVAQPKNQEG